jgi:hypothetical protein
VGDLVSRMHHAEQCPSSDRLARSCSVVRTCIYKLSPV